MPINFSYENSFKASILNETYKTLDETIVELSIPSINIGSIRVETPVVVMQTIGTTFEIDPISVRFVLSEDYSNWVTIFNWMNNLRNFQSIDIDPDAVSDIAIHLLSNKLNYNFAIVLQDCYPIGLSDIPLTPQISEDTPLSFTANFVVNNISLDQQEG